MNRPPKRVVAADLEVAAYQQISLDERPTAGIENRLKEQGHEFGFSLVGIAHPERSRHTAFYRAWLERGAHGDMSYLARSDAVARREDLRGTLADVRTVVMVAQEYLADSERERDTASSTGVIARYARGRDYHKVVEKKLRRLLAWLRETEGFTGDGRVYVDTGPILERELAQRAGLGWFGKNTMLIHPRRGSWFFLGCLLLDIELTPDAPIADDHCGTCSRCLDACPTGALLGRDESGAPRIDARRCISYLTIEHRGSIPRELRSLMGNRVFGCDICQDVCPFNIKFAKPVHEPAFAARGPGEAPVGVEAEGPAYAAAVSGAYGNVALAGGGGNGVVAVCSKNATSSKTAGAEVASAGTEARRRAEGRGAPPRFKSPPAGGATPWHPGTASPSLPDLMAMALDEASWESFSRGSGIRRAGRAGFARNVAIALGNWGSPSAIPALVAALSDPEPLVRAHAAWALGVIGSPDARCVLEAHRAWETDDSVLEEMQAVMR